MMIFRDSRSPSRLGRQDSYSGELTAPEADDTWIDMHWVPVNTLCTAIGPVSTCSEALNSTTCSGPVQDAAQLAPRRLHDPFHDD